MTTSKGRTIRTQTKYWILLSIILYGPIFCGLTIENKNAETYDLKPVTEFHAAAVYPPNKLPLVVLITVNVLAIPSALAWN